MKVLKAKEIYNVDALSPSNDAGWKKILEAVDGENEEIVLDFKDMIVSDPWNNRFFLSIIRGKGKTIRFYDSDEMCNGVRVFSFMNNVEVKIENIKSAPLKNKKEVVDTKLKAAYERKINALKKVCRVEDGVGYIQVYEAFENLGNVETVESIGKVIPLVFEGVKVVRVELGHATIQENMFKLLMSIVKEFEKDGVKVLINSDDVTNRSNLQVYRDMKFDLTREEKYEILKDKLFPNMPVLVSTFKRSKSVDKVGREGEGKETALNPAVIKELVVSEDREGNVGYKLIVDLYRAQNFMSKMSYGWDNDGAEHPGISKITQEIDVEDVGFLNEFVGRRRHIYAPIHTDDKIGVEMYVNVGNGKVEKRRLLMAEGMKVVFDDFGVDYNRDFLESCIKATKEKMRG